MHFARFSSQQLNSNVNGHVAQAKMFYDIKVGLNVKWVIIGCYQLLEATHRPVQLFIDGFLNLNMDNFPWKMMIEVTLLMDENIEADRGNP